MKRKYRVLALLCLVILLPYLGFVYLLKWYNGKVRNIPNTSIIIVDKSEMKLSVVNYKGETTASYPLACGKNYGTKQKRNDFRTPEGVFRISEIQDARDWVHDFKDGKGEISGAYGPHFLRLEVPGHKGIGIHGTHAPESIGTRVTEGCIRLKNDDIEKIKAISHPGMVVIITPSALDVSANEQYKSK